MALIQWQTRTQPGWMVSLRVAVSLMVSTVMAANP